MCLSAEAASIPLQVRNRLDEPRSDAPVTWSVPLRAEQNIRDVARLRLTSGGAELPAQFTPLARWGGRITDADKPLSWVLVDTRVSLGANATLALTLEDTSAASAASPLRVLRNDASSIVIATGAATYELSKTSFDLFRVTMADGATFGAGGLRFNGRAISGPCSLAVEHSGSERISLIGRGTIEGELEYTIRMQFYRELAEVKIDLRLENLTPPMFDGQPRANDYGSQGSISFDDFSA
ncbi:MAG TPA: hypothetical protein VG106_12415, partial [Vicinamibacterales bacterium]|nr:hypothetical protein [Vicinamibacterales bacterium]